MEPQSIGELCTGSERPFAFGSSKLSSVKIHRFTPRLVGILPETDQLELQQPLGIASNALDPMRLSFGQLGHPSPQ